MRVVGGILRDLENNLILRIHSESALLLGVNGISASGVRARSDDHVRGPSISVVLSVALVRPLRLRWARAVRSARRVESMTKIEAQEYSLLEYVVGRLGAAL